MTEDIQMKDANAKEPEKKEETKKEKEPVDQFFGKYTDAQH